MDFAQLTASANAFWVSAQAGQAGFIIRYAGYGIAFAFLAVGLRLAPKNVRTWGLILGSLAVFGLLTNAQIAAILAAYIVVFYAAVEKLPKGHLRSVVLVLLVSAHFIGPIYLLPHLTGYEGRVREYVAFSTNLAMLRFWGYAYDRSRRAEPETPAFADYALYMLFFPSFVNGPIVTHIEFNDRKLDWFWDEGKRSSLWASLASERTAIRRAVVGVVLGVSVMVFALPLREEMQRSAFQNPLYAWPNAAYTYMWWYFSFVAWTEASIGFGRLAGIKLPENFDRPHYAYGPADFWRRWNITFMVWLRRFIFLPLGGALIRGRDGKRHLEWRNTYAVFIAVCAYHLLGGIKLLGFVWYPWTSVVPWIIWGGLSATAVLATRHFKRPERLGLRGVGVIVATLMFTAAGHMTAMYPPQGKLAGLAELWKRLFWPATNPSFLKSVEHAFSDYLVAPLGAVLFFDLAVWTDDYALPAVVVWLVLGAIFFTLRFQFVNFRAFRHAIDCVRGRYSKPEDPGEISHFQALSAALSATVGLGNIAGVAVAVGVGGPGAVIWMMVMGFFGMTSKFAECTLAQLYRVRREDGQFAGGPQIFLQSGLAEHGWANAGKVLSVVFAIMCIGGSFGGGNMFQSNQAYAQFAGTFPALVQTGGAFSPVLFGAVLAALVGIVIIGGIKRIGEVAGVLVPLMCIVYVTAGLFILLINADRVPAAFGTIVDSAFSMQAGIGGLIGTMIQGFRRAAFSNEAGAGSAAIAHAAAATPEPVREGIVALLEPFVDTIVVCTMTGLVIVVTGAYTIEGIGGIQMTSAAFESVFPWFKYVLSLTAVLFAFSTMISWSYYGEQCWTHLFGMKSVLVYKAIFLLFVWTGAIFQAQAVLDFGDLMILGMAFPNIIGIMLLSGKIKTELDRYLGRLEAGEFDQS
ncbi:MAG: amino acid carrier protein [Myxococcota bacterium]|nr:amino acid carrier protein [Myxococcota bacterium]